MTAPAVVAAPEITQEGRHGISDAMESIASMSVAQTIAEQAPAEEPATRDEKGRFVPKGLVEEGEQAPATAESEISDIVAGASKEQALDNEDPAEDNVPESLVMPEGYVAVPKIEGRELATPFTLKDADGEIEVPDLTVTFTANGKVRNEPLDKVVKLAQFGVYNEQREQQVQQSKREVNEAQTSIQELRAYAQKLTAERERLLSDDDAYLTARAEFEVQNTPEARMQRERAQLMDQQDRVVWDRESDTGQRYFATTLTPALDMIASALPTIHPSEIAAQLLLVSERFKVHTKLGTIIPARNHAALNEAITSEIVPLLQQMHAERETTTTKKTAQTDAEKAVLRKQTEQAQIDAQKKTRLLTKAGKPGAGQPGKTTLPPKPIKTVEDAEESALTETLAAMGMSRSA